MLQELSSRLSKLVEQKRLKVKRERDLLGVEAELREQTSRLGTLEARLEKEKVDLQKLERAGLTALFHSVLGNRDAKLEKERQEFLAAQLQYQGTLHQVAYLEREREYLNAQITKLTGVEAEYQALLSEKEALLRGSDPAVAGELVANAERIAQLASHVKELSEAIQAGDECLSSLGQVLEALESAKGWGTLDLLGGGLLSTAVKHDRIDAARAAIHAVQAQMSRFERELADVREQVELGIEIGEFETFADFFFDGLIFDWAVQSKIDASLERTQEAQRVISRAIEELKGLQGEAQKSLVELEEKRAQIITRA